MNIFDELEAALADVKKEAEKLRALLEIPTETQLQAIIENDAKINDELAYFTEGIKRIFEARLKGGN